MRILREAAAKETDTVVCNVCGKKIIKRNGFFEEDFLSVEKSWGYFSAKDGDKHSFEMCEECYDAFVKTFKIPVESKDNKEII